MNGIDCVLRLLAAGHLCFLLSQVATAAVPAPEILPRAAWDALPADNRLQVLKPLGQVRHVSVHHTAVANLRGDGTPEAELRIIQHGHRDDNGWGDIAYHYLIAPDGRIFAGRDPQYAPNSGTRYLEERQWKSTPVFSADDQQENPAVGIGGTVSLPESETGPRPGHVEGHLTICLLGNFMEEMPTDAALEAFVQLCAYLIDKYELAIRDVWLHREVASTLCPGNQFYAWLRAYPGETRYALGPGLLRVEAVLREQ